MNIRIFPIFCLQFGAVIANLRVDGKKILCSEFNAEYIANVSCSIKLKNRFTQIYSNGATLKPGISITNAKVKLQSFYKFRTEFRPIGVKYEEDVCEFLNNINGSLFLKTDLFKNLNPAIYQPCPLVGTRETGNFEIDTSFRFPALIPTGEYRFDSVGYTTIKGKEVFLIKVQNFLMCSEVYDRKQSIVKQNVKKL